MLRTPRFPSTRRVRRVRRLCRLIGAISLLLSLTACPTIWQYNALKQQVQDLEKRNETLQGSLEVHQKRLQNLDKKHDSKLEEVLDRGASTSAQLEELRVDQTRIKGKAEEVEFYLTRLREMVDRIASLLDDRFGMNVQSVPDYAPKEPKERFVFAKEKLAAGDAKLARSLFRTITDEHPGDALADDAQFMVGETFYAEKKYTEAIRAYRVVHDKHRKSSLVLTALLRIGECFEATGACKKATQIYDYARDFAKKAEEKADLKQRLGALKKTCK